ncbi:MAG: hypothetical protein QXT68_00740 [Halobacteria archaeon]
MEFEATVRRWGPSSVAVTLPRELGLRAGQRVRLRLVEEVDLSDLAGSLHRKGDTWEELRALRGRRD